MRHGWNDPARVRAKIDVEAAALFYSGRVKGFDGALYAPYDCNNLRPGEGAVCAIKFR